MAYQGLREFLARLEKSGELHRITVEADPVLEIAEITDRQSKSPEGGMALLFERVKGSRFPLATNLFGSYRRVCAALEVEELSDITRRVAELLRQDPGTKTLNSPALCRSPWHRARVRRSKSLSPALPLCRFSRAGPATACRRPTGVL
jgi:4-hydroxy-3-polyprenylbenzoate decarboxylase